MQILNKCNIFSLSNIKDNGVRMQDQLLVTPMQGRAKNFALNRVSYLFQLQDDFKVIIEADKIYLPRGINQLESFKISLLTSHKIDHDGENSRYMIEALGDLPFKLNGNHVFKALLERGDKVKIGNNHLYFSDASNKSLIGDTPLLPEVLESELNILLEGETGTGKSYLAKQIHEKSSRNGRFVHINLASYSPHLLESELFGHMKGSFTGALSDKSGAIMAANYGTLFLDEIDSIPHAIQTKLLLFLDSHKISPVGCTLEKQVDVRLIFASGSNLRELVHAGKMRSDFFFRIASQVSVELLPLRKNTKQIEQFCQEYTCSKNTSISKSLIKFYQGLAWPGNIRQLKSHLEKKCILSKGKKICLDHTDDDLSYFNNIKMIISDQFITLKEVKKDYCKKVLAHFDFNYRVSSDILQISSKTLKAMMVDEK